MPKLTVAGQSLYFAHHRARSESETQLILIHGAGGSHLDWPAELRRLPRSTVLIPDLPGHGRSSPPLLAGIADYASLIRQWIDELSLPQVVLVGHSMGGAIVLQLALQATRATCGIVLLATGARLRVADAILEGIGTEFEATVDNLLHAYWGPDAPPEVMANSRRRLHEAGPARLLNDFRATDAFDIMGQLDDIAIPALIVTGEHDPLTPPKYARYLAEHIEAAELRILPGAYHMVHHQRAADVARFINGFVTRVT